MTDSTHTPTIQIKGCVIRNPNLLEEYERSDRNRTAQHKVSFWKKYIFCCLSIELCRDYIWLLAVRCAKLAPNNCAVNCCCVFLDKVRGSQDNYNYIDSLLVMKSMCNNLFSAPNKASEKEQSEWRIRTQKGNASQKTNVYKGFAFSYFVDCYNKRVVIVTKLYYL